MALPKSVPCLCYALDETIVITGGPVNIVLSFAFFIIALVLPFKKLVVRCIDWLLSLSSWRALGIAEISVALPLLLWSISIEGWFYYTTAITLFVLGLLMLAEGIFILTTGTELLRKILRWIVAHYYAVALPVALISLLFSIFILSRAYIGPIATVSPCESGNQLSIACVVSNPEDMVITPDQRFVLISEFGGIRPLSAMVPGRLAMLDAVTKTPEPLAIIYSDNSWGDNHCSKTADSDFGPHGMDLVKRNDGRYQIAVVNHMGGESVEMFELVSVAPVDAQAENFNKWGLIWRGCVMAPKDNYLNDVTLLSDGSFFVSHMYHPEFSVTDFLLEVILKRDTGYVMHWDDHTGFSHVPGTEGAQPNGVAFDQASNVLYVAFNIGDKVSAVDVTNGRVLKSFAADGPDNLVLDNGKLWLTELNHEILDALACEGMNPCALPFSVIALDASRLEEVGRWSFSQQPFGLPTVALPFNNAEIEQVFIGSMAADRFAYFDLTTPKLAAESASEPIADSEGTPETEPVPMVDKPAG